MSLMKSETEETLANQAELTRTNAFMKVLSEEKKKNLKNCSLRIVLQLSIK